MLPGYSLHFSEKYLRNLVTHALHVVMYDSITYGDILLHVVGENRIKGKIQSWMASDIEIHE